MLLKETVRFLLLDINEHMHVNTCKIFLFIHCFIYLKWVITSMLSNAL